MSTEQEIARLVQRLVAERDAALARATKAEGQVATLRGRIPRRLMRFLMGAAQPDRFDGDDMKALAAEALIYLQDNEAILAITAGEEKARVAELKRVAEAQAAMRRSVVQMRAEEEARRRKAAERRAARKAASSAGAEVAP